MCPCIHIRANKANFTRRPTRGSVVARAMKTILLVTLLVAAASATQPKIALSHPNVHITNGQDAAEGQFPYQISYQWGFLGFFQHVCGGSIISPTWILTAGHCVTEVPAIGEYKIIAGITTLDENNPERQEINVINKIVNPNFDGGVGPNDVALLQLASPLQLNDKVQPISLPAAGSVPAGDSVLSGWGSVSTIDIPFMPDQLQTADLPILSYDDCRAAIDALLDGTEENPLSEESNVCTGPLTGGVSACSGDSGGPLVQDGAVIGIVSWGFTPCGSEGAPSVYTRVSSFVDFISEYVTDLPKKKPVNQSKNKINL
jgi:prostatin (serine protease 8)